MLILIGLSICTCPVRAQDRAIKFEEAGFGAALSQAKSSGKLLFVDAFTSWCGPCKLMAKNVFTQNGVADFFNANFVNFAVDTEKGEGVEVRERYKIEVYPTFLLIDGNGDEVFRVVGEHSGESFIELFRNGMNPENSVSAMKKKFEAGERDQAFVARYVQLLARANQREEMDKVLEGYFRAMPVKDICEPGNWALYSRYVTGLRMPLYRLMVENAGEFRRYLGDSLVNTNLGGAYNTELFGYIINPKDITPEVCTSIEADLEKMNLPASEMENIGVYFKVAKLKAGKQYAAVLDMCDAGIPSFTESQWCTLAMGFGFFKEAAESEKARAFEYVKKEFFKEKERGEEANQNVLYFLSTVGEQIKGMKEE